MNGQQTAMYSEHLRLPSDNGKDNTFTSHSLATGLNCAGSLCIEPGDHVSAGLESDFSPPFVDFIPSGSLKFQTCGSPSERPLLAQHTQAKLGEVDVGQHEVISWMIPPSEYTWCNGSNTTSCLEPLQSTFCKQDTLHSRLNNIGFDAVYRDTAHFSPHETVDWSKAAAVYADKCFSKLGPFEAPNSTSDHHDIGLDIPNQGVGCLDYRSMPTWIPVTFTDPTASIPATELVAASAAKAVIQDSA